MVANLDLILIAATASFAVFVAGLAYATRMSRKIDLTPRS